MKHALTVLCFVLLAPSVSFAQEGTGYEPEMPGIPSAVAQELEQSITAYIERGGTPPREGSMRMVAPRVCRFFEFDIPVGVEHRGAGFALRTFQGECLNGTFAYVVNPENERLIYVLGTPTEVTTILGLIEPP